MIRNRNKRIRYNMGREVKRSGIIKRQKEQIMDLILKKRDVERAFNRSIDRNHNLTRLLSESLGTMVPGFISRDALLEEYVVVPILAEHRMTPSWRIFRDSVKRDNREMVLNLLSHSLVEPLKELIAANIDVKKDVFGDGSIFDKGDVYRSHIFVLAKKKYLDKAIKEGRFI
jgi:hypothetical protein